MVKLNPANFVFHSEFTYNKILREGSYTKPAGVTGTYTLTTGLQPWTRWDIRQRFGTDDRIYATDRQNFLYVYNDNGTLKANMGDSSAQTLYWRVYED